MEGPRVALREELSRRVEWLWRKEEVKDRDGLAIPAGGFREHMLQSVSILSLPKIGGA